MIALLISLVILAVVVSIAIWLVKYVGGPEILVKVIVVLAVLAALLMVLDAFGIVGTGIYHRSGPIYVR